MAVVMMGSDEKKPIFHDFLGMSSSGDGPSNPAAVGGWAKAGENAAAPEGGVTEAEASVGGSSGGHGLVSGSSDLGSERQGVNMSEVFHSHGRKNATLGSEISNMFAGRKRSSSDSAYMGLIRDRMLPLGSDCLESTRLVKMLGKEVMIDQFARTQNDQTSFSMQPPLKQTAHILRPQVSGRPDSQLSKLERPMPMNHGSMVHCPSRFAHTGTYLEKLSSSYPYRDATAGATLVSQAAADEGSRTGIKGSGIMNIVNTSCGTAERNITGSLPSSSRSKAPQIIEPETSNIPNRHGIASVSRQMTIFYAGQAHVFDDVHPNKADVIMALAGSNGGSWCTTYSQKSAVRQPSGEAKVPSAENEGQNNLSIPSQKHLGHAYSQAARIPLASDPPNILSGVQGGQQGGVALTRPVAIASANRDTEGKREA